MFHVHTSKSSCLLSENCIVFHRNVDRGIRSGQARVQDLDRARLIVHCIVDTFLQLSSSCGHANRTLWYVKGPDRDAVVSGRLISTFDLKTVFFRILKGGCLGFGIHIPKYVTSLVGVVSLVIFHIIGTSSK